VQHRIAIAAATRSVPGVVVELFGEGAQRGGDESDKPAGVMARATPGELRGPSLEVGERGPRRLALGDAVQRSRDRRRPMHARAALARGFGRQIDRDPHRLGDRTGVRGERDEDPAAERCTVARERSA